jgi:hypothetical protein
MSSPRSFRNTSGVVLPTRLMVFSISAVALGGLAFFATQGGDSKPDTATPSAHSTLTPAAQPSSNPITAGPGGTPSIPAPPPKPVNKAKTTVVVFNNTNIKGLAGKTATRVENAGWNVFKTDNWTGVIDASTVYFGPGMRSAAQLLATDLGIKRTKPLINGMNPKMLNVVLTTDYQ